MPGLISRAHGAPPSTADQKWARTLGFAQSTTTSSIRPIMSAMLVVADLTGTVCRDRLPVRSLTIKPVRGSACGTDQAWAGRSSAYDGSHDAT